ncbi:MAG: DNA polymerase III subunit delta [Bacillota bacterium]
MKDNVMVFYGEDSFYMKNKIHQTIRQYEVDNYNLTTYDMDETELSDAINDALTIPFLSEKKVVICKNARFLCPKPPKSMPSHNINYLKEYLDNPTSETLFILSAPCAKLDNRLAIVKTLKEKAEMVECRLKGPEDLKNWARRQIAQSGLSIDRDALDALMKRVQHSTEFAFLEMRKLLLYAEGKKTIDKAMIEQVITRNIEDNVFDITQAILERDHAKALRVYQDLITYKEDPLKILGIIVSKYREMAQVKRLLEQGLTQDDIQRRFDVKSGRAYFMVQNAKSAPMDTIEEHLKHLERLDRSIKTGRIDKKMALELFILNT